jgi:DNA-binding transcriptional regulator YdaS (Cro superfamily)
MEEAVKLAIESLGISEVARQMGVTRQAVHRWYMTGHVPAERVLAFESVTGLRRETVRPDLYPRREEES